MGVKGLSAFMLRNPHLFTDLELHDCDLVVDGNNLCHYLFHVFNVDSHLGGDYSFFYSKVVKFLESFKRCKIRAFFVFDGAYDPCDGKLKTTIRRAKERLTSAKQVSRRVLGPKVLPVLAMDVFRDALVALSIPHAHSDYEADVQIVALANHLRCPVLSRDSDFYIYDIGYGFVPLDLLNLSTFRRSKQKGSPIKDEGQDDDYEYDYMSGRIYFIDRFLKCFDGLDRSKLPLLAAIVGNDNVDYGATLAFFKAVTLPRKTDSRLTWSVAQKPILGLLAWLQRWTNEETVEKVVTFLKGELKSKTRTSLMNALDSYNICSSSLLRHLRLDQRKETTDVGAPDLKSVLMTKSGRTLSEWCHRRFQNGIYPPFFLNVLANRRVFLLAQVENWGQASSYDCSLFLRQIIYGILLSGDDVIESAKDTDDNDQDGENSLTLSGPSMLPVTEYSRKNQNFFSGLVPPFNELPKWGRLPGLEALPSLSQPLALNLLLEALHVDTKEFVEKSSASPQWSLFICAIVYWLKSSPSTTNTDVRCFLDAILLTALTTSLTNKFKKVAGQNWKRTKQVVDENESASNGETVSSKFQSFVSAILSHKASLGDLAAKYQCDLTIDKLHPLNLQSLHWYAEFQSVLLYASYLNRLLGCPLPSFRASLFLNGILLYNVYADLSGRSDLETYLGIRLGKGSPLHALFVQLQSIIVEAIPVDRLPSKGARYMAKPVKGRATIKKRKKQKSHNRR